MHDQIQTAPSALPTLTDAATPSRNHAVRFAFGRAAALVLGRLGRPAWRSAVAGAAPLKRLALDFIASEIGISDPSLLANAIYTIYFSQRMLGSRAGFQMN